MMYSEFVEGTGCRDNEYNHMVFRRLEIVYMNDDSMTKEEVYEWGKKLVDNSLTEEQKQYNASIKADIEERKTALADTKETLDRYKNYARLSGSSEDRKYWNEEVKFQQQSIRNLKQEIRYKKECIIK